MTRKARKKPGSKSPTSSKKMKKAIGFKSMNSVKNPVAKKITVRKPARNVTWCSAAEVAKLRKAVRTGLKARKLASDLAVELGISKTYLHMLNRG